MVVLTAALISTIASNFLNIILSKTSHPNELVARINLTNLTYNVFRSNLSSIQIAIYKEKVATLIEGVRDYLVRVVGSVPIALQITEDTISMLDQL